MRALVLVLLLAGCGHTELPGTLDSGMAPLVIDENVPLDGGRDAGATRGWCAPEAQPCWHDGWDYDHPGSCCLSRQTCKSLDRDAGRPGYCEY
ncbi:MAG: hypothetical protein QM817_20605 [Archangium sp.]